MLRKKRRDVNPIDVIEAAYDLDASSRDWLDGLAKTIRPLLFNGRGMIAYTFDASMTPESMHANALLYEMDPAHLPEIQQFAGANPDLTRYVHFNNEGLLALVDLGKRAGLGDLRQRPAIARYFQLANVVDFAALQTVEPGGKGVVFAAGQTEVRNFDVRTRRLWARVNAHIAAGRRLRDSVAAETAAEEAVLLPSGKLEHAEGEGTAKSLREALREAVLRSETARGKLRKADPEGATEAWTAMVSGRWSLVDRFERGGRRYIVARRNQHELPDPRALTQRERAVAHLAALGKANKLIGYELGLSESSVGSHLSQAMRKLGAKSRVDLIQLVVQLGMPPSDA